MLHLPPIVAQTSPTFLLDHPCIASSIDSNQLAHAPKNNPKTVHQALQKQVTKVLKAYGLFYDRVSTKTNQNRSHD